ncbi:protein flp [Plakobranchus ocellatus]|uniref:Protein flp n=1 Tax=Plakobranchus ocellatus TaxID=259542 RepID=A0AAV4APK5_9GAST|nr:protein flp [Plakobranchus ocellatus]
MASVATIMFSLGLMTMLSATKAELLSSEDEQRLVSFVNHVMECRNIPGLTMTLVKGKEHKTFPMGVSNKETGEKVDSSTLFYLGSLTQSFTSTLIAVLTQRSGNVIHFDSPISQLIGGELRLTNRVLSEEITLRDALMHRTGLSTGSIGSLTGLPKAMSRGEVINHLKHLPLLGVFRDDFSFNQFIYTLAAYVGEKITGTSWEKLMRTHLLDRLLMSSTLVEADDVTAPGFARSYVSNQGVLKPINPKLFDAGPLAPASFMFSNADDMIKGLKFFLGAPNLLSQVQLPPPVLEEVMNPRLLLPVGFRATLDKSSYAWPVSDISVGYAMGFFRNIYRGMQVPWHASSTHGFTSIMWLVPERSVGVFISINGQKYSTTPLSSLQTITYTATDLLLGEEPWINETTACTFPEPWIKMPEFPDVKLDTKDPDHALEAYVGTFGNDLLGDMILRKSTTQDKALAMVMADVTGYLVPEGGNIFRLFLDGDFNHLRQPEEGKQPLPFLRFFFDFKAKECVAVKVPDSIFGGSPVTFHKKPDVKEEL